MKYFSKKILTLFLLVSLFTQFSACGNKENTSADETLMTTSAEISETEPAETELTDSLPEMDYDGADIRLLVRTERMYYLETEETGDLLDDAVYKRNREVEERFNVKISHTDVKSDKNLFTTAVQSSIMASDDGYDIYVGKNNTQNDYLTLKFANSGDIWFHTKNIHGSHTVIKLGLDKNVPEKTMMEAASLAAFYSKARESSQVPVDYTQIKNVKKPNGAKPGMVIYDFYNTVYVTPKKLEKEEG